MSIEKSNLKKIIIASAIIASIAVAIFTVQNNDKNNTVESNTIQEIVAEDYTTKGIEDSLFFVHAEDEDFVGKNELGGDNFIRYIITPKKEKAEIYESLGPKNSKQSTVVIIPLFTMLAYTNHGFYDYYAGVCDEECLTVNGISVYQTAKFDYRSSAMANQVFQYLGYERISDADVDRDPSILSKFDKVILLHNEYVTKKMFDAITSHPKVIYLYPNALYAEIYAEDETSSITLIRGHGYPEKDISNGFN